MMKQPEDLRPTPADETFAAANVCKFIQRPGQTDQIRQNPGSTIAPKQNDEDDPGPAAA
jgi:hypothetical protein